MNAPNSSDFLTNSPPILSKELEAAKLLISQLKSLEQIGEDDADLIGDMVEGETQLVEAINATIARIHADEALIEGMKVQEERLEMRRKRFQDRNERRKWAIANALTMIERKRHEHPLCTISRRGAPPRTEILSEMDLPAKYWRKKDPEVDKRTLLADLKEAALHQGTIPGAALISGEITTVWSWK